MTFSTRFITFFMLLFLINCSKPQNKQNSTQKNTSILFSSDRLKTDSDGLSLSKSIIKTPYGNIVFKFYPKHAPNTVSRVIELINTGFYDGLTFHRVVQNFVIQTGDPTNTGKGGSGRLLKSEFNELQHIKGTVAMARNRSNIDSADSQFYISLASLPHLDKKYTVFGQVIEGIDLLDKIQVNDKIISIEFIPQN